MKNYLLTLMLAIFAVSCSKKVEVEAKINGGSPLERMEFIDASGVATLPLINIGQDKTGKFSGSFEAPKNGMYLINYAGRQAYVFLKGGQKLQFTANITDFPNSLKFTGDAKANNDFIKNSQENIEKYAAKINIDGLLIKDEAGFLKDIQKLKTDIDKILDTSAEKNNADADVLKFKKDEFKASILALLTQYEIQHPSAVGNPGFKVSEKFKNFEKELSKDNDQLVKSQPIYRNYLLNKLAKDYQEFTANTKADPAKTSNSELFSKFLDTHKELSPVTKDYLLAFVMGQFDINPSMDAKRKENVAKLISEKIKDGEVKKDLEKLLFTISGPKIGETVDNGNLIKQDGSAFKLDEVKGKPTALVFYASWNPYIAEGTVPVLKEIVNFYKSKMNFAFVNMDDTKEQFTKTSSALLKGIPGTNIYPEGGLNSKMAKNWGIYAFKMPSVVLLDKDGKVASKFYFNLADDAFIQELDKMTGLKAPMAAPEAPLPTDLLQPKPQVQQAPAPQTK